jgi:hypothetical protein
MPDTRCVLCKYESEQTLPIKLEQVADLCDTHLREMLLASLDVLDQQRYRHIYRALGDTDADLKIL